MVKVKHETLKLTLILLPLVIAWVLMSNAGLIKGLDNLVMDFRFKFRGELNPPDDIKLVYVNVDQTYMSVFGERPFNRAHFAMATEGLFVLGKAKAVGFDFVMSRLTSSTMVPQENVRQADQAMGSVTMRFKNTVLAASYSQVQEEYMDQPSVLPVKYKNIELYYPEEARTVVLKYNPKMNPFPESPTFPIWDQFRGHVGLINPDEEWSGGAVPRRVPLFVEVDNDTRAKNFISGIRDFNELPEENLISETERFVLLDDNGNEFTSIPRNLGPFTFFQLALEMLLLMNDLTHDNVDIQRDRVLVTGDGGEVVYNIPLTEGQLVEVNWFDKWENNTHVSLAEVLENLVQYQGGTPDEQRASSEFFELFNNAVILIGPTDPLLQDVAPTPFDNHPVPKVGMHGSLLRAIHNGIYLKHLPQTANNAILVLLTFIVAGFGIYGGKFSVVAKILSGVTLVSYVYLVFYYFKMEHLVLPVVYPVASVLSTTFVGLLLRLVMEERQKGRIQGMFGIYLAPELVDRMVESGDEPELGGVSTDITAFFSDVQSFSTFSELLTPEQLVELLNDYLSAMTDMLMEEGCFVDKYEGDAIIGIFNAPVEVEHHALRACIATQRMQKIQAELREKWKLEGDKWPSIVRQMQTRVGLNTGRATVGNMGSAKRFNYTMMGDTVNLAARCESGAKAYGVYSMITRETKQAAEKDGNGHCVYRYLDKIVVKGRSKPAEVYEVLGIKDDIEQERLDCLDVYSKGLEKYLGQDWVGAMQAFEKSLPLEPNRPEINPSASTSPSQVLIERCTFYKENPPGDDWDAVFEMTEK